MLGTSSNFIQQHHASFSSKQRCINFNNLNEGFAVSNDDVLRHDDVRQTHLDLEPFEPTVFSSEGDPHCWTSE